MNNKIKKYKNVCIVVFDFFSTTAIFLLIALVHVFMSVKRGNKSNFTQMSFP